MSLPSAITYRGRIVLLKYHKLQSGYSRCPPNSLSALREILQDARAIEFDVRLLGDGTYALLHEERLEAETTGMGPVRSLTADSLKSLRLRGWDEPPALLREIVEVLRGHDSSLKVQVDLKELLPLSRRELMVLLRELEPLREAGQFTVVVSSMADWNLRTLRRLDPTLPVGFDIALHLDAPVGDAARLPVRVNAYGYLDDHPLGFHRVLPVADYLQDRLETLLRVVDPLQEVYLRKEFVLQALGEGVNPIEVVHRYGGILVDVWTFHATDPQMARELVTVLDAGADQVTTGTPATLPDLLRDLVTRQNPETGEAPVASV